MKRKSYQKGREAPRGQPDLFAVMNAAPSGPVTLGAKRAAVAVQAQQRPKSPAPLIARPANGLLRVREAAARLGLSKSTLDKMRCDGRGPRYVKVTSKIVGYDPADLDAYAESRKRSSTAE